MAVGATHATRATDGEVRGRRAGPAAGTCAQAPPDQPPPATYEKQSSGGARWSARFPLSLVASGRGPVRSGVGAVRLPVHIDPASRRASSGGAARAEAQKTAPETGECEQRERERGERRHGVAPPPVKEGRRGALGFYSCARRGGIGVGVDELSLSRFIAGWTRIPLHIYNLGLESFIGSTYPIDRGPMGHDYQRFYFWLNFSFPIITFGVGIYM